MDAIYRIRDRAGRTTWWSDRWAWRGALAAAPLGALAAILHALLVLRAGWTEALMLYVIGAMTAAGIGCLLGGALGAVGVGLRDVRSTDQPEADAPAARESAAPTADAADASDAPDAPAAADGGGAPHEKHTSAA